MKYKIISYNLLNSNLNYRLNDNKLFVFHNGLSFSKSNIDINLDLIIDNEGNIDNSLNIKIEKIDSDTYKIKYADLSYELVDILFYYLDDNNIRQYVAKEDVTIKPDGTLEYNGHIVKTYYKNDNGYILTGDYTDFINSNNIDLRNEELINLEQEVININGTIKDLEYQNSEYGKVFDIDYILYNDYEKNIEQLQYDNLNLQVQFNENIKNSTNSFYTYKHQYYTKTKKRIQKAWGPISTTQAQDLVDQYLYDDTNGALMEMNNLAGYYSPGNNEYSGLNAGHKAAKYYEFLFMQDIESINKELSYYNDYIEQSTWINQKSINQNNKTIKEKQNLLLAKKNILEQRYNTIRNTYYSSCIEKNNHLLDYYNKLKTKKEYELNQLKKQVPIMFLIDSNKKVIYGFNEYNNLSIIFDKYNNQLLFDFDTNNIKSITTDDNKKIELKYNSNNKLVSVINDIGKNLKIEYENDRVKSIINDNDITNINYVDNRIFEIIDNSNIGYRLYYNNDDYIDEIEKYNTNAEYKSLCNYLYNDNIITLIDKTKYVMDGSDFLYSKYDYIFDNDNSLLNEIEYRNDEIYNILGYEFDSNHCNFTFNTNKNDDIIYSKTNESFTGIKTYNVSLPQIIKTDYTLYAILEAESYSNINEYRTTAYCSHTYNISNIKYEIRINLVYSNETITYGVSLNPDIISKQLVAIPITLKEDINGKAIRPNSISINVDYSNNNGSCNIINLKLADCSYQYIEYNMGISPKELWVNDIKYPIIEDSIKTGYVIKNNHIEYEYNINELKEKEINYISYEKYDLSNNLIETINENIENKYYYDNNSNIIKIIDSKSNVIEYEYDDKGNIIKEISYSKSDSSNKIINESKYEENGSIKSLSNELGYYYKYKDNYIETPSGFIIDKNDSNIKSDLLSHSNLIKNGKLEQETSGDIKYSYTYDEWGYESSLLINDNLYMRFQYNEYLGNKYYVSKLNDNTGYMKVTDSYDKLLSIYKINNETEDLILNYNYDSSDNLISITDKDNNTIESYEYIDNKLSKLTNDNYIKKYSNDIYLNTISVSYDNDEYDYEYNNDNNLITLTHNDYEENIDYDSLKRIKELNSNIISNNYEYLNINNRSTNLVKIHKQKYNNKAIYNKFMYDKCGNIIKSEINHNENTYHYDGLNRIIRWDSKEFNHTYTYSYDENNNIISKGIHDYSNNDILLNSEYIDYNYDKDNKLLSYSNNEIIYDNTLRPINYKNNILEWDNNKLIRYGNNYYEYDYNGLRIKKITSNKEIKYIRDGNKLLKEVITTGNSINGQIDNASNISNSISTITYNYGASGIIGFTINSNNQSKDYYYIKNIYNDVVEVIDEDYNIYAKYSYDIFGKCNIIINVDNIANINPIRYRSYYYDNESNLYYLNTRYYDPDTMRFISLDSVEYKDYNTLGGLNLFVYCNNNPVMNVDPDGSFVISLSALIIGAIVGATLAFGTVAYLDYKDDGHIFNGSIKWYDYLGATLLGGVIGAIAGVAVGGIAGMSFTATIPTIGFVNAGGALSIGITGSVTLTVSGTQILTGVGLAGLSVMMAKKVGKYGGYKVNHNYPNDHQPAHVHVYGDDIHRGSHGIRVGIDGKPLEGEPELPSGARKAVKKLLNDIIDALKPWIGWK